MAGLGLYGATVGSVRGLQVQDVIRKVINRTGGIMSEGDLVQLDISAGDADVSNYIAGEDNSIFSNAVRPERPTCKFAPVGIVVGANTHGEGTATYADNATMYVQFCGIVKAFTGSHSATLATSPYAYRYRGLTVYGGARSSGAQPKYYLYTGGTAGERVVAWPLEQSGTAKTKIWCVFDGLHGLGTWLEHN